MTNICVCEERLIAGFSSRGQRFTQKSRNQRTDDTHDGLCPSCHHRFSHDFTLFTQQKPSSFVDWSRDRVRRQTVRQTDRERERQREAGRCWWLTVTEQIQYLQKITNKRIIFSSCWFFLHLAAVLLLILPFVLGSYYLTHVSFPPHSPRSQSARSNQQRRRSALRYVNIHFTCTQTTRCSIREQTRIQNKQSGSHVTRRHWADRVKRVFVCRSSTEGRWCFHWWH